MTGAITPDLLAGTTSDSAPWMKLLLGGMFGAGELGNILQQHKQDAWQSYVMNLLKNPQQLSAMATAAAQPLSQSLIKQTTNAVQGELGARGLAQSPGIFNTELSQALAGPIQANYNNALSGILHLWGFRGRCFRSPRTYPRCCRCSYGASETRAMVR